MLSLNLSQADIEAVNIERKTQTSSLIRDRMLVLHLVHMKISRIQCAEIVGCHRNTVTSYIRMYNEGGLTGIRNLNYPKDRHELKDYYEKVDAELEGANCNTVSDASDLLKTKFGYDRGCEAVRRLLHKLGYRRKKTGSFPGKIDDFDKWQAKQDSFEKKLYGLIEKADNQEIDMVFGDAAHFVYGKFSNYTWGKKVRYIPSGHGRYRINVYGAYDVVTNQVYSMYNEGYVNAEFMVEYLTWLRTEIYDDRSRPLHFILDNARYQHCTLVKETAKELNVVLEFLPGYSPNLNLIERLWKYMKKIIGKEFFRCKETFCQAIVSLLENLADQPHQDKLWTLLNPIFQRFEKAQILSG